MSLVFEVLGAFLKLGLTSFGGPIAHLGYFRREFVERRRWVTEDQYSELLALCQFLPGPASSQLGFTLGLVRAGFTGALAAFAAFTLPSAILMLAFAKGLPALSGPMGIAVVHGLKLVAVVVVAQAVILMSRQLCSDWPRRIIALSAAGCMLLWNTAWTQMLVIAFGAAAGFYYCAGTQRRPQAGLHLGYGMRVGWTLLAVFATLLCGSVLRAQPDAVLPNAMSAFYRAGALVFGGGHVVLPLLKEFVVDSGWISADDFLAGYGAAQAVPGPMFTLAAYLGALLPGGSGGALGASAALAMIFLPGFLLVGGTLPLWQALRGKSHAARALAGVNAAVVGLLAAAFYNPVWRSGITDSKDAIIALSGLLFMLRWHVSPLWVVLWCVGLSVALG